MSIAYLLDTGYSTINNKFHNFWDLNADVIKNTSLNPQLNPTSVAIGVNTLQANPLTGALALSATGIDATLEVDILKATSQVETVIITTSQINTDEILPSTDGGDVTVTGSLVVTGDVTCKQLEVTSAVDDSVTAFITNTKGTSGTQALSSYIAGSIGNTSYINVGTNSDVMATTSAFNGLGSVGSLVASKDLVLASVGGSVRVVYNGDATLDKALSVAPSGAVSFDSTCVDSIIDEGSYGVAGQMLLSQGASSHPYWADAPTPYTPFVSSNVLFVDKAGSDTTGTGCEEKPFLTISKALTTAATLYPARVTITVANGSYAEDLTITKANVLITGMCTSANQSMFVSIVGTISINLVAGGDLHNNQIVIQNLGVTGKIADTTAGYAHTVIVQNVRLYGNDMLFAQTTTGADCRTYLNNIVASQDTAGADTKAMILLSAGMSTLNLLDCTARNNCPVLKIDQSAKIQQITFCKFESSTTSSTASPIVVINVSTGSSSVYAMSNCAFAYSSTTNKSASANSSGILMNSTTGNPIVYLIYSSFNLQGTTSSNYAIQDANAGGATQGVFLFYSNNASIGNASAIRGTLGVNKLSLQAVA